MNSLATPPLPPAGGMHAAGLVRELERLGLGCTVIEPTGYRDDEAALLAELEAAVARI